MAVSFWMPELWAHDIRLAQNGPDLGQYAQLRGSGVFDAVNEAGKQSIALPGLCLCVDSLRYCSWQHALLSHLPAILRVDLWAMTG